MSLAQYHKSTNVPNAHSSPTPVRIEVPQSQERRLGNKSAGPKSKSKRRTLLFFQKSNVSVNPQTNIATSQPLIAQTLHVECNALFPTVQNLLEEIAFLVFQMREIKQLRQGLVLVILRNDGQQVSHL